MSSPSSGLKSKPSKRWAWSRQHRLLHAGLLFNPEDRGDMFLWNIGWLSTDYIVLCHTRQNSSFHFLSFWYSCQCSARQQPGWPGFDPQQGQEIFLFSTAFRPALGPTHPPIQWVLGELSMEVKWGWGMELTAHLHLVPRSRMAELYFHSPIRLHGVVLN
jgi:hypothetical protein